MRFFFSLGGFRNRDHSNSMNKIAKTKTKIPTEIKSTQKGMRFGFSLPQAGLTALVGEVE